MTAEDHPLLRYAPPAVREAAVARLGLRPPPEPERPVPVDADDVIARLRSGRGKDPRYVLDGVAVADWDLIVREHRRAPLPDVIGAGLVARDDCPPWAVLALVVANSTSRRGLAVGALAAALRRGVVTPRQVMFEAAPGWSALRVLEKYATRHGSWLVPIRRVLDEAAELQPGDDVAAWLWLCAHGPAHPGTFPQLCAAARHPDRPATAPEAPAGHWDFANPAGPLSRTSPRIAAKVIAALPPATISAFLETPQLPASVVVPALRRAPDLTAALVRQADTGPRHLSALLDLRMPEVNSALLRHADPDIAYAVFRATRRDHPHPVPLTPEVRRELISAPDAAAVHGHYPQLTRLALTALGPRLGTAAALRGCLSLAECQGPDALRDPALTADLDETTRAAVAASLAAADHGADALAVLRAHVDHHETPDALVTAVRERPDLPRRALPPAFWPAAVAAHARDPLPDDALLRLAQSADCPEALGLEACRLGMSNRLGARSRAYALTALTQATLRVPENNGYGAGHVWYLDALGRGHITAHEFVELGHGAHNVLEALDTLRALLPDEHAAAVARIAALADAALGTDPETWTIAAHLLPDFVGTLPELLDTVGAVTA